jgi:hypothetical protein
MTNQNIQPTSVVDVITNLFGKEAVPYTGLLPKFIDELVKRLIDSPHYNKLAANECIKICHIAIPGDSLTGFFYKREQEVMRFIGISHTVENNLTPGPNSIMTLSMSAVDSLQNVPFPVFYDDVGTLFTQLELFMTELSDLSGTGPTEGSLVAEWLDKFPPMVQEPSFANWPRDEFSDHDQAIFKQRLSSKHLEILKGTEKDGSTEDVPKVIPSATALFKDAEAINRSWYDNIIKPAEKTTYMPTGKVAVSGQETTGNKLFATAMSPAAYAVAKEEYRNSISPEHDVYEKMEQLIAFWQKEEIMSLFTAAFDNPIARRKIDGEYADEARRLIRYFDGVVKEIAKQKEAGNEM